ncbi:unnamed protein product, partial [Sphagnum balticum]
DRMPHLGKTLKCYLNRTSKWVTCLSHLHVYMHWKGDVYSFGVVLLELVTGHKPIDTTRPQGETNLITWARPLLDERNLDELVDPRFGNTYNVSQMQAMISAAVLCVQESSQQGPKI